MCSHETPQEAARCSCTGYGFGDPPCRCGYPKSQHKDGTGACMVPAARCHEFVISIKDPFPITVALVQAAADGVMIEMGLDPLMAHKAAMASLFAGRRHAVERDFEIKSVRAQNDRLRKQLDLIERELNALRAAQEEAVLTHDQTP